MNLEIKRDFNRLRFQWRELSKEHKELLDVEKFAWAEFYSASMEYIEKNKLDNPFEPKNKKVEKNDFFSQSEEAKALFREAVVKTHPDKTEDGCTDLFNEIAIAKKKGDLNEFLENAKKVNVKIENVTVEQLRKLEEEIESLQNRIDDILFSAHWIWYHANNKQKTIIIIKVLNDNKKEN